MFLRISNAGICYPEAFTMLGISTARGEDGKIGQFGSGAKHGILTCLRHGINPVVVSGDMKVTFDCIGKMMGNKPYDQVVALIGGKRNELGFSLEFGALDWVNINHGLREFVSNAIDQGDVEIEVVSTIDETQFGRTSVYIEYTDEVKTFHTNVNKMFLQLAGEDFYVSDNKDKGLRVYKQGVLVYENDDKPALFRYNLSDLRLDESRNAEFSSVKFYCALKLYNIDDKQADKLLEAFVDGVDCFETSLDQSYMDSWSFGEKIRNAFTRKYGGEARITTPQFAKFCGSKYKKLVIVNEKAYSLLQLVDVPVAIGEGGHTGAQNGFVPIKITTDCKRIFNRVWKKVENLGLHKGKEKPALAMYAKPMDSGCQIGGYYENDTVYIERNSVNAKVILEEIGHYVTGANDCTRDFQDWAFAVGGALM